ncbi:pseudouridine synthase [Marinomonas fungiae]|uniref:Pseudouridine synthase n=1 Tax=Marinomonas fungiae TaxID=1137284 RepID=A0A0K6IHC9_9GAMM|nr:pseudouridine synthase [Marinomonas fungiae]CUB02524.1 ribosomal small subunit pseudouridine synthase A [Marinomonas fungiae]
MSKPFTDAVVRLDFYVSHTLGLSRKEAKVIIGKGQITINGAQVKKASQSVQQTDVIYYRDELLAWPQDKYFLLNKPAGYVCATEDGEHPVVLDLIAAHEQKDLRVVGRLDMDTTGFLLLTTDGQWLHRITSPKSDCPKRYRVWTVDEVSDAALRELEQGVQLKSEDGLTKPAKAERIGSHEILLTISEGKYHQVKRMLAATGNKVERLHREAIANVALGDLAEGQYRSLSEDEIAQF